MIPEKLTKLMSLALNNPSEEEAKTAALIAIRFINEKGLLGKKVYVSPPAQPAPKKTRVVLDVRYARHLKNLDTRAQSIVIAFVQFLKDIAGNNQRPVISSTRLLNHAISQDAVSKHEARSFRSYLNKHLRNYVEVGTLEAVRGRYGGYTLRNN